MEWEGVTGEYGKDIFLSDKRLRAALTTLFGMYEDTIFGAVVVILWPWGNRHRTATLKLMEHRKKHWVTEWTWAPPITKILIKLKINVLMAEVSVRFSLTCSQKHLRYYITLFPPEFLIGSLYPLYPLVPVLLACSSPKCL